MSQTADVASELEFTLEELSSELGIRLSFTRHVILKNVYPIRMSGYGTYFIDATELAKIKTQNEEGRRQYAEYAADPEAARQKALDELFDTMD